MKIAIVVLEVEGEDNDQIEHSIKYDLDEDITMGIAYVKKVIHVKVLERKGA